MSFLRHEEIYRPMSSMPGQHRPDRPRPHRFDELPGWLFLGGLRSRIAHLRFTSRCAS